MGSTWNRCRKNIKSTDQWRGAETMHSFGFETKSRDQCGLGLGLGSVLRFWPLFHHCWESLCTDVPIPFKPIGDATLSNAETIYIIGLCITREEFCVSTRPSLRFDVADPVQKVLRITEQSQSLQGLSASCTADCHLLETAASRKKTVDQNTTQKHYTYFTTTNATAIWHIL